MNKLQTLGEMEAADPMVFASFPQHDRTNNISDAARHLRDTPELRTILENCIGTTYTRHAAARQMKEILVKGLNTPGYGGTPYTLDIIKSAMSYCTTVAASKL